MVTFLFGVVMLLGVIGVAVPFVPSLTLICVAAIGYGFYVGFDTVGLVAVAVILLVTILSSIYTVFGPSKRASIAGANRWSIGLGIIGAITGFFVIPVLGFPLGGVAGVYLGERLQNKMHEQAMQATIATIKGIGVAIIVELGAALLCFGVWIAWVLVG